MCVLIVCARACACMCVCVFYGLNCVSPDSYVEDLNPVPQTVTTFRDEAFKGVITVK